MPIHTECGFSFTSSSSSSQIRSDSESLSQLADGNPIEGKLFLAPCVWHSSLGITEKTLKKLVYSFLHMMLVRFFSPKSWWPLEIHNLIPIPSQADKNICKGGKWFPPPYFILGAKYVLSSTFRVLLHALLKQQYKRSTVMPLGNQAQSQSNLSEASQLVNGRSRIGTLVVWVNVSLVQSQGSC